MPTTDMAAIPMIPHRPDVVDLSPTPERVLPLNSRALDRDGRCVVYWMQSSLRFADNPALETAAALAHALDLPLVIWFGLSDAVPQVAERSARFLLDGLADLAQQAAERPFTWHVRWAVTTDEIVRGLAALHPAAVVTDMSHLRFGRSRRAAVAHDLQMACVAVDSDVVVPVWLLDGPQVGARTLRPRLWRLAERFQDDGQTLLPDLRPLPAALRNSINLQGESERVHIAQRMTTEAHVPTGGAPPAGEMAARSALRTFIDTRLNGYAGTRRDVAGNASSQLSAYLRYGMLSPRQIMRAVERAGAGETDRVSFLDELVIRRELSSNYVWHEPHYATFAGLPGWARTTLLEHADDPRQGGFSEAQMEAGTTGDPLFDAAMRELRCSGTIHNFARMYWGKQILAWHPHPQRARSFAQELNDRYGLDGRSPNGFANVAWCFGMHDRPWPERAVFGKVRSMTLASSGKKINLGGYVERVHGLAE